jgi:hypothetical protein
MTLKIIDDLPFSDSFAPPFLSQTFFNLLFNFPWFPVFVGNVVAATLMSRHWFSVVVGGVRGADDIAVVRVAFCFVAAPHLLGYFSSVVVSRRFAQFLRRKSFALDVLRVSVFVCFLFLLVKFARHFYFLLVLIIKLFARNLKIKQAVFLLQVVLNRNRILLLHHFCGARQMPKIVGAANFAKFAAPPVY